LRQTKVKDLGTYKKKFSRKITVGEAKIYPTWELQCKKFKFCKMKNGSFKKIHLKENIPAIVIKVKLLVHCF